MNGKPRVLLTAAYGPNQLGWGEDMYDLLASRLGRGHGPFQMTSHCHYFALYLIAENISNPTTVLENPHWDEFDRELDEGYDYVGFQLKSLATPKIARMMKRVREKLPKAKIIVGGYGVGTLGTPVPGDKAGDAVYIRENADYLCREEGVGFMRRILTDEPLDREITQYNLPMAGFSPSGVNVHARTPTILVSLGCPNACDFCNTSAFFHHKKIYVAEPAQVIKFIKNYQRRLKTENMMFLLWDEDFFLNKDYVQELGKLLRSDRSTWGVKYFTFGSMRSLSQFGVEEIRDNGCGAVWIGVESFMCGQDLTDQRYAKRQGEEIKKMFDKLHQHGIYTTASLVLGFDFHTPENLKDDIDRFVELKPGSYQLSPLLPCPGTALYEKMDEEGRILDTYKWENLHLWSGEQYKVKNFENGQIKEFFDYAHQQLRDENGPQALLAMENALDSYQNLKNCTDDYHAFRAQRSKSMASGIFSYLRSVKLHHSSEKVRAKAVELEKRFHDEIGEPPLLTKVISYYLSNRIRKNAETPPGQTVSDPPPRWSYYHTYDDRVWVRKGRRAGEPVPYKDRQSLALTFAKFVRGSK